MNREIKFRAFDGVDYVTNPFTLLDIQNGKIQFASSDTKIMQFTGLKDKNGVEIFNADIFSDKWKAEVYQNDEGTFMVRVHNNPKVNKPRSLKKYLMDREIAGTSDRDCSVIGNIYQNPDLLESVQK